MVKAKGKLPSGALRESAFKGWHPEKGKGILDKEAANPAMAAVVGGISTLAARALFRKAVKFAKRAIWKRMSVRQKARFILRRVFG